MGDQTSEAKSTMPKRRIILIEDEPVMWEIFEIWLRQWFLDFELLKFDDGDKAWAELSRQDPDLLIMDWEHPGMHGREIFEKLVEKKVKFPLIVSSGMVKLESGVTSFTTFGLKVGFLSKPFKKDQFWRQLSEFVGPSDFPKNKLLPAANSQP